MLAFHTFVKNVADQYLNFIMWMMNILPLFFGIYTRQKQYQTWWKKQLTLSKKLGKKTWNYALLTTTINCKNMKLMDWWDNDVIFSTLPHSIEFCALNWKPFNFKNVVIWIIENFTIILSYYMFSFVSLCYVIFIVVKCGFFVSLVAI